MCYNKRSPCLPDVVYRALFSAQLIFDKSISVPSVTITVHPTAHHQLSFLSITVDLHVDGRYGIHNAEKCDWDLFFSTLAQLQARIVAIGFCFSDQKDYRRFHSKIVSLKARHIMDGLCSVGKLTSGYRLGNSGEVAWFGISDDRPLGQGTLLFT